MKIKMIPRCPSTKAMFWCSSCDSRHVDSENPESGKFFVQFGHSYNRESQEYNGDYRGVMFALCNTCLED